MKLELHPFATDGILAGSLLGQRAFAALIQQVKAPAAPEVCFLDFASVKVATLSFLRDSVLAFRNHARAQWPTLYPVVANLAPAIEEEFSDFLQMRNDAMVMCELDASQAPHHPVILGTVDGKQLTALDAVLALREADAPQLAHQFKEAEPISTTAWNNRLAALVAKGLLIEISSGRGKRYRPVLEGLAHGS